MDESMRALMARLEELLRHVHQYVGARYVPNFIDESWTDVRGYEALDVVDNGTGTSYIAKKPVPPGTPLTDREYWFVYGSTSGAIINLQNQIDAIVDNLEELSEKFLSKFKNKSICIIGDSTSDPNVYPPIWADSFTTKVANVGATVNNVSVSGSSILSWSNDITRIPTNYDIYIVVLGVNDFQGQFTLPELRTAVEAIATRCDTQNHDCYYVSPIKGFVSTWTTDLYTPLGSYRAFFEAMFNKYGFTVISGDNLPKLSILTHSYFLHDSLHPDPTLADIYADYVIDAIMSGVSTFSPFKGFSRIAEPAPNAVYTSNSTYLVWEDERSYKLNVLITGLYVSNTTWTDAFKVGRGEAAKGFVQSFDDFLFSYEKKLFRARVQNNILQLLATEAAANFNIGGTIRGSVSYDQYIG